MEFLQRGLQLSAAVHAHGAKSLEGQQPAKELDTEQRRDVIHKLSMIVAAVEKRLSTCSTDCLGCSVWHGCSKDAAKDPGDQPDDHRDCARS